MKKPKPDENNSISDKHEEIFKLTESISEVLNHVIELHFKNKYKFMVIIFDDDLGTLMCNSPKKESAKQLRKVLKEIEKEIEKEIKTNNNDLH